MTAPGTMGQWWVDRETERAARHAENCKAACRGQDAPSDLWVKVNEERYDYSDDGPGALAMMLVCFAVTVGAIAAAFYFI